jgi:hypothetical protein
VEEDWMRDNGIGALLDGFRDEDLVSWLYRGNDQAATAIDSHLKSDNPSTSFFNNYIG